MDLVVDAEKVMPSNSNNEPPESSSEIPPFDDFEAHLNYYVEKFIDARENRPEKKSVPPKIENKFDWKKMYWDLYSSSDDDDEFHYAPPPTKAMPSVRKNQTPVMNRSRNLERPPWSYGARNNSMESEIHPGSVKFLMDRLIKTQKKQFFIQASKPPRIYVPLVVKEGEQNKHPNTSFKSLSGIKQFISSINSKRRNK